MKIEATVVRETQGYHEPFVRIGGHWYLIETKQTLLNLGIASVIPMTHGFENDLHPARRFSTILPADPDDGRPEPRVLQDATRDPDIAALARKWLAICLSGETPRDVLT